MTNNRLHKRIILIIVLLTLTTVSCKKVQVTTYPIGATFSYKDNNYTTPANITVYGNELTIELLKKHYEPYKYSGKPEKTIHINLEKTKYKVEVSSNVKDLVFQLKGKKNNNYNGIYSIADVNTLNLPSDEYSIKADNKNYEGFKKIITVVADSKLHLKLEPKKIDIDSKKVDGLSEIKVNEANISDLNSLNYGKNNFEFMYKNKLHNITGEVDETSIFSSLMKSYMHYIDFRDTNDPSQLEKAFNYNKNIPKLVSPTIKTENLRKVEIPDTSEYLYHHITGFTEGELADEIPTKTNILKYSKSFYRGGLKVLNLDFGDNDYLVIDQYKNNELFNSTKIYRDDQNYKLNRFAKNLPPFHKIVWKWELKDPDGNVLSRAVTSGGNKIKVQAYNNRVESINDDLSSDRNNNKFYVYFSGNPKYMIVARMFGGFNYYPVDQYEIIDSKKAIYIEFDETMYGHYIITGSQSGDLQGMSLMVNNEEFQFDIEKDK